MMSRTFKLGLLRAISICLICLSLSCVVERPVFHPSIVEKISLVEINTDNLSGFSTTQPFLPGDTFYWILIIIGAFFIACGISGIYIKKKRKVK